MQETELAAYLAAQVSTFFPDHRVRALDLYAPVRRALPRAEHAFSRINQKYFRDGHETIFNHYNTNQYSAFLYFVANSIYRENGPRILAEKLFALNKALHAIDLYFEIEMPDVFLLQHPVGTVLGRAQYADYFCIYQGCSVGSNLEGVFPSFGEGVVMLGGSRVNGASQVGENCWFAPGAIVLDTNVPSNTVTFGIPPWTESKPTRNSVKERFFFPD